MGRLGSPGWLVGCGPRRPAGGLLVAGLLAVLLAACGGGAPGDDGRPRLLASTPLVAEFARRVAGDDASVSGLIPPGADLHRFEPPPEAARRIARADLLLVNGYRLEESLLQVMVQNRRPGTPLVAVAEGIEPIGGARAEGERAASAAGDPHLWLDVANAVRYVERIRGALVAIDAAHADGYRARAASFADELRALDAELRATLAAIAPGDRKIVVFHDAFQYFARAYGFELAAAVLPASPSQQPSAADVARIVRLVREQRVPAVYSEPEFSSQVLDVIAEETGARVLTLYDGPIGGEIDSYAAMMRANARALVQGLGSR